MEIEIKEKINTLEITKSCKQKLEKPSYVIRFIFSDDKILNFTCVLEKNEAKRIARRINKFL